MKDYKTDNKSFPVYKDWEDLFNGLDSDEEAGKLIKALIAYAKRGDQPNFTGALKMAFIVMAQQIDRDGKKWEEKCIRNSLNGKKGGAPKGNNNAHKEAVGNHSPTDEKEEQPTQEQQATETGEKESSNEPVAPPQKKERKKPEKIKYAEFVSMKEEEYKKLVEKYGEPKTKRMIEVLDNYKGSKGKTYKDDYRAILNWVVERVEEEYRRGGNGKYEPYNPTEPDYW